MPAVFLLAATQTYSGVMVDNLCISKGKGFDDVSIYVKKSSGGMTSRRKCSKTLKKRTITS
jgi:hypothetical protein